MKKVCPLCRGEPKFGEQCPRCKGDYFIPINHDKLLVEKESDSSPKQ